jgi:hypothetical protein
MVYTYCPCVCGVIVLSVLQALTCGLSFPAVKLFCGLCGCCPEVNVTELEAEEAFLKMLSLCYKQGKMLHPPLNLFNKFEQAYMDARKEQLQQGPTFSVNMYVSKDMLCKWVTRKKNRLECYPTHGFKCTAGNTVNAYARWKTTHLLNRQSFGASQTLDALLHDDGLEKYSVIKVNEWGRRHCRLIALDLENGLLKNFGLLQGKNHLRSSQDLSFDKYSLGELDKKKEMRIDHVLQCERSTVDPCLLTIVFIEQAHHAHWQLIFNSQDLRETFCDSLLHSSDTEKQRGALEAVDAFRTPGRSSASSSHWDILRQSRGGSSHRDHGMSTGSLLGGKGSQRSIGNLPGSPSYSAALSSNSVRGLNLPAGVSHLPGSPRAPSPSHEFSNSDLTGVVNPLFESKSQHVGGGHVGGGHAGGHEGGHEGVHEGQLSDKIDGMVRSFNARLKSIDETHRSDKRTLREMISKQHTIHHEIVTTIAKSISSLKADIYSIKARDNDAQVASGTSGAGRVLVGGGGDEEELECLRQNVRDLKKRNLELESKVRESSWRLWW